MLLGNSPRARSAALVAAALGVVAAPLLLAAQDFTGQRTPQRLLAARVAHATTDLTNRHRFSILVRRVDRIAQPAVPAACGLATGLDAAVLHLVLANLEATPFDGRVEHFLLVWETDARVGGSEEEDVTCALADPMASYFGTLSRPISPHGQRRARVLFAVPTGARLSYLAYDDDDAPARFAL